MAVAVLSPWPTSQAALASAVACVKAEIGPELTDERLQALGSAAAALVEDYAPGAPQPLKNEAVIRCAGWLAEQPRASVRSEQVGQIITGYATAGLSALRHSGGMALLTTFKVRRAGAI